MTIKQQTLKHTSVDMLDSQTLLGIIHYGHGPQVAQEAL